MSIHPEGKRILFLSTLTGFFLSLASLRFIGGLFFIIVISSILVILFLIFRFFRNPERNITPSSDWILAPADGKVVAIERVTEQEYLKDERIQVSIFMSIHNVHKNWYPLEGVIMYFKYHPGKYLLARHPKSSSLNERSTVVIKSGDSEILVRQIAGFVARRIICNGIEGKNVNQRDELGFIKFGSRVDLFIPVGKEIDVEIGEHTKGGITRIAKLS